MYLKMIVLFFAVVLALAMAGMPGAPVNAQMDDEARNALQFAIVDYNNRSNDAYLFRVTQVITFQKQVVAGMKYIYTVNMARTVCKKGGAHLLCAIAKDPSIAKVIQCKIAVWVRSWLNEMEVVENSCL